MISNEVKSGLCIELKTRFRWSTFWKAISVQIIWDTYCRMKRNLVHPRYSAVKTVNPCLENKIAWGSTIAPWFIAFPWKRMTVPLSRVYPRCESTEDIPNSGWTNRRRMWYQVASKPDVIFCNKFNVLIGNTGYHDRWKILRWHPIICCWDYLAGLHPLRTRIHGGKRLVVGCTTGTGDCACKGRIWQQIRRKQTLRYSNMRSGILSS
jgi:hypothetical protein